MSVNQGPRVRARDSRGREVRGVYVRDGRFVAGFTEGGRWQMRTLDATTITEARRERESLVAGLREGRIAATNGTLFRGCFDEWQDSREISAETREHEKSVRRRYLSDIDGRRVQEISASDVARLLRGLRGRYSSWTCVHAYKVMSGVFGLATRRGYITRNPIDGLAPSERPKQKNKREIARLDAATLERLVAAGGSERWRAALALASFAGLRAGEIRALTWGNLDLDANTISVSRSALPSGEMKAPKTAAGVRVVPLLPSARRRLVEWKIPAPRSGPDDLIIGTAEGKPIAPENLRRALADAKQRAGLDGTDGRLSLHALRHSYGSLIATDLQLAPTTVAMLLGHTDAGFSLKAYARDARDHTVVVADVLARAASAQIGG